MKSDFKKLSKQDQILKAAQEVFARFGYDKTTLDDIGKRCGLNKASLYYYFKNKEEIFVQVVLNESETFIQNLQQNTNQKATAELQAIYYLTERVKRYEEVLNVAQLSLESLQKVEPLFLNLYQKVKEKELLFLEEILRRGMDAQEIKQGDAYSLAESLFIISDALKHDRVIQKEVYFDGAYDMDKVEKKITHIVQLIFLGLKK